MPTNTGVDLSGVTRRMRRTGGGRKPPLEWSAKLLRLTPLIKILTTETGWLNLLYLLKETKQNYEFQRNRMTTAISPEIYTR